MIALSSLELEYDNPSFSDTCVQGQIDIVIRTPKDLPLEFLEVL